MTEPLDDLTDARLAWTSPTVAAWYPRDDLRRQLRRALEPEADRMANPDFGLQFRDAIGIDGPADPLAWANRRLDLPGGGWAVTGIRFRGGVAKRPFVDVVATSAPPTGDGLAEVAAAVLPAYAGFTPRCLRTEAPDVASLLATLAGDERFGPCSVDQYVVAGLVSSLRAEQHATAYLRVSLRAGQPAELAARAREIYDDLGAGEPGLAAWASPEDADSLADCAEEGLLFEVLVDGVAAGVVAALRHDAHGMTGFSVHEICLDAAHRGQHLAPATLQRLLDALPARSGDTLWGTIHPANRRSLRNALSIGRVLADGYVWVTPAGLLGMPDPSR
jgi:hypothetical protein